MNILRGTAYVATSFGEPAPAPGSSGEETYCFYNPEDPTCAS